METAKATEIWNLITSIDIKDNQYTLTLKKENKKVYLGKATDLTNMMMYVKVMIEKEEGNKGEIFVNGDLNSGFKPYFRETIEEESKDNKNS